MLSETGGLKGRAARAGKPVTALDPAVLPQRRAVMPFRAGWVAPASSTEPAEVPRTVLVAGQPGVVQRLSSGLVRRASELPLPRRFGIVQRKPSA